MIRNKSTRNVRRQPNTPSDEGRRAFERVEPRLRAMSEDSLIHPNLNLHQTATLVLAAEVRIRAMADELHAALPQFELANIRTLRDVALAAVYINVTDAPSGMDLEELVGDGRQVRRALLVQANALAEADLVDRGQLANVPMAGSIADLGASLLSLSMLFRDAWARIEGRTPVTSDDLDHATELGLELARAAGAKRGVALMREGEGAEPEVGAMRARVFSLLVEQYGEVKAAIDYVRRKHGDAGEIAPSLYAGNRGGKRNANPSPNAADEPPQTVRVLSASSQPATPPHA